MTNTTGTLNIYTSPLLHKMQEWNNASLGMYIDDGAIFACGKEWNEVVNTLREGYRKCTEWLTRSGLKAKPNKTELIFFRRRGCNAEPPPHIQLPLPEPNTYYRVQAVNTLRYLGFFFDSKLTWKPHTDIMANRTRATIKMLQLLGNSVRGLDHTRWKLAYNAICLPVLTYGCQLWYTGKQKGLVKKLQLVQNKAVKVISGSFKTAPWELLHHLLTILPMDLCLDKLTHNSVLRLYCLPKSSQLLRWLGEGWHQPSPDEPPLPTPNNERGSTTLRKLAAKALTGGL